jgi:hypothetical protein
MEDEMNVFQRNSIARNIERDILKRWGWKVTVKVTGDGDVNWEGNRKSNPDRYDMYPGMTREQADQQVMDEILSIIQRYIPTFQYTSYEQSGQMHYIG